MSVLLTVGFLVKQKVVHLRQAHVAARGAQVMPFNLEETTHIFQPFPEGGLQTVVADNPTDTQQISLIQTHLQSEANKFSSGDFSDPAAIHGDTMPGLSTLSKGYQNIQIQYSSLPNGGEIRYRTQDSALISALHDWFAAQRSDHGHHAQ
ncbi:MAG: aspartate carbamoyltransferase [Cyanobacteria bacterium J06634_5]